MFDIEGVGEYRPLIASPEDIARVHFCFPSVEAVTTHSHHISAGGAIRAAGLVLDKERERAFAIVRPPGHHAMRCVHGSRGFCNINIEAIMVEWIRERMGNVRVANIIMLGAIVAKTGMLSVDAVSAALTDLLGKKKAALLEVNLQALNLGITAVEKEACK